ncbi:ABC transporter G family protein [Heterostelium album PN500]|uniref:ABC transporter G family protein n=1 Tax=Heterostelium pallidum (strain ATCC 26659 / Pp 5 / PN500) TaxID=670386 RepID=D3BN11_HETP5|nr:ABC transporter G family protein [Heterostelium album PN500]EFA77373.1 ABC transporter G family protein [Heterostelium album PN500]|eukprot:XP_020429502.1 ABC transporter G family protein [Heterostelium album PN500]
MKSVNAKDKQYTIRISSYNKYIYNKLINKGRGLSESTNGLFRRTLTGSGGFSTTGNGSGGTSGDQIEINTPGSLRRNSIDERIHLNQNHQVKSDDLKNRGGDDQDDPDDLPITGHQHHFPIPETETIGEKQQFTNEIVYLKHLTMPDKTGMYVYAHHLSYCVKDLDNKKLDNLIVNDKDYRVDHMMQTLGLWEQRDTLIGNEFVRGISGGQKKRVTIGVTIIKGSNLLLIDEPTNGLDSTTSLDVIGSIRKVVTHTFSPALVTLLQPSAQITSLFDNLIVLSQGQIVYFGPMSNALSYFEELGFTCPKHFNPSEFFQEIVDDPLKYSFLHPPKCQTTEDFANAYRQSKIYRDLREKMDSNSSGIISDSPVGELKDNSKLPPYTLPMTKQIEYCTKRGYKLTYRNFGALVTRFFRGILMGLILGTLYLRMDHNQGGGNSRFGLLYFSMTYIIVGAFGALCNFYSQKVLFYIQRRQRYYSTAPFLISTTICEIPGSLLEIFILMTLIHWILDTMNNGALKFICSFSSSQEMAAIHGSIILGLFLLVAGYMVPEPTIRGWWIWLYYLSPYNWMYQGMIINEFAGQAYHCSPNEMVPPLGYPLLNVTFDQGGYGGVQSCAKTQGEQFLHQFGMRTNDSFRVVCLIIVIGYCVVFNIAAYFGLRYFKPESKPKSMLVKPKSSRKSKHQNPTTNDQNVSQSIEMGLLDPSASSMTNNHGIDNNNYMKNGCELHFMNLTYEVDYKNKTTKQKSRLRLLDNVEGYAKPGSMLAIMGPSGAGKSTLLDILSDRKSIGYVTGTILIDGKERTKDFVRYASYVEQQDILPPTQTVGEAILFSARCRLSKKHFDKERLHNYYEQILDVLNLRKIQHNKIGIVGNGISLSQRKRVSIGIELASNPKLLFIDEPTTGLDSGSAHKVMEVISKIAKTMNRTVICTIHQPSAAIFEQFDQLLLLCHGKVMYFGPLGNQSEIVLSYYAQQGRVMKPHHNPADFLLEMPEECNEESVQTFKLSHHYQICQEELNRVMQNQNILGSQERDVGDNDRNSWIEEFKILMRRAWDNRVRRPKIYVSNWTRSIVVSFVLGTLFFRLKAESMDARNRISLMFFSLVFFGMSSVSTIPTTCMDRAVFYREQASGFYRETTYFLSHIVSNYPFIFVIVLLYSVPLYFLVQLDTDPFSKFFFFIFILYMASVQFDAIAFLCSLVLPNDVVASSVCGLVFSLSSLFAGFMISRNNMPTGWRWMNDVSIFKYPIESVSVNEFAGKHYSCPDNRGAVPIHVADNQTRYFCPITDGEQFVLHSYSFKIQDRYSNIAIMFAYLFAFYILSFIALKKIKWQKR